MYIRTSYTDLDVLIKTIEEFFDILCDDECKDFKLMIGESDGSLDITVLGEIDDFTSHNLVGWLARPGFSKDSFDVLGHLKFEGDIHFVTSDLTDQLGEHLLAIDSNGDRYKIYVPECTKLLDCHDVNINTNIGASDSRVHRKTMSPNLEDVESKKGCILGLLSIIF